MEHTSIAASVLRTPGKALDHARFMRTKNSFVDIIDATAADCPCSFRRTRSCDGRTGEHLSRVCNSSAGEPLVHAGPLASVEAPCGLHQMHGKDEGSGYPERFVTVVRNTFVKVRDMDAEAEQNSGLRRSRSQDLAEVKSFSTLVSSSDRSVRGSSSTCSSNDEQMLCRSPARDGLQGANAEGICTRQSMCVSTPLKAAYQNRWCEAKAGMTPDSITTCASTPGDERTSRRPSTKSHAIPGSMPSNTGVCTAFARADAEQACVRLKLEKIIWGRLPGKCMESNDSSDSSDDSDDDDGATCRLVSQELATRINELRASLSKRGSWP